MKTGCGLRGAVPPLGSMNWDLQGCDPSATNCGLLPSKGLCHWRLVYLGSDKQQDVLNWASSYLLLVFPRVLIDLNCHER